MLKSSKDAEWPVAVMFARTLDVKGLEERLPVMEEMSKASEILQKTLKL